MNNSPEGHIDPRRLQLLALLPLTWFVCVSLVPDFLMRVSGQVIPSVSAATSGIGIVLISIFMVYILTLAREKRSFVLLVVFGALLVLTAQALRMARSLDFLDKHIPPDWQQIIRACDNLSSGLGLALVALAFFYAVIDMLVARHQLIAKGGQLAEEIRFRAEAEKALIETTQRLQLATASAGLGVWEWDIQSGSLYWDDRMYEIYGVDPSQFLNCFEAWRQGLHPDDRAEALETSQAALRGDNEYDTEFRIVRPDGTVRTIKANAVVKRDENGNALRQIGLNRDITEHKQAQEALLRSETKFRTLFDSTNDAVMLLNEKCFFECNDATLRIYGCKNRSEFLGAHPADFSPPEQPCGTPSLHLANQRIALALEKGSNRFEWMHKRLDTGELFPSEVLLSAMTLDGHRILQATVRDISRQKKTEEALRESEAKYRDLVQSANTIILRINAAGLITFFNEFARKFFGYEENEILGRSILGTLLPQASARPQDLVDLLGNPGVLPDHSVESEYEIVRRDGKHVWVAWTGTPVYDSTGHVRELLCVGNDVTERIRSEQAILEQRAKMINTSRLVALGTMAGGIAHEINNPLAIISVACQQLNEILMMEHPDKEHVKKASDTIERSVDRISRIVRGLKMLSREERLEPASPVPVKDLIDDTLELCRARFAAHGIALLVPRIPDTLTLQCRPTQVSQVLLNLLNNAYDAVECLPEKWVHLDITDDDDDILISVTDSGKGLPPETRDKVFLPFFTTKDPGRGLGLGLSVSARLLEAHEGELIIEKHCPNTRFTMRLPKQVPHKPTHLDSPFAPPPQFRNR